MPEKTSEERKKITKKQALGRGLGSLLGGDSHSGFDKKNEEVPLPKKTFQSENIQALREGFVEEVKEKGSEPRVPQAQVPDALRIWQVPIERIKGNPRQPRRDFDGEAIRELADSIKEQGILQPIVARKLKDGNFQIIAGERRWRAAQQAGIHQIPVILKQTDDQKALELALIENIQRENLNPMEEAEAYDHLMKTYGLTQQQLAEKISKERATIANSLRLLQLHPELRNYLRAGELSTGQAKVLLAVQDPGLQKELGFKVIKNKMTVRQTEKLIQSHKATGTASKSSIEEVNVSKRLMKSLGEELQKLLGTRVSIDYNEGKGKVKIHFYSDSELNQIAEKLKESWQK